MLYTLISRWRYFWSRGLAYIKVDSVAQGRAGLHLHVKNLDDATLSVSYSSGVRVEICLFFGGLDTAVRQLS